MNINFLEFTNSYYILDVYDKMNIESLAREFFKYSNQEISEDDFNDLIKKFRFSGLSNADFLTSDFLNAFGFKNLIQYMDDYVKKTMQKLKQKFPIDDNIVNTNRDLIIKAISTEKHQHNPPPPDYPKYSNE